MNIYIYGCGAWGKSFYKKVMSDKCISNVIAFIDIDSSVSNEFGIPIITLDEYKKVEMSKNVVVVAISNYRDRVRVLKHLSEIRSEGVFYIDDIFVGSNFKCFDENGNFCKLIHNFYTTKPYIDYIEYLITDYCNLKCSGCSHFANLCNENKPADIDMFSEEIKALASIFSGVKMFRLLGGEPFLNRDILKYIYIIREKLPYTQICIVTNGTILNNLDEKMWSELRNNQVEIDLTIYPGTEFLLSKNIDLFEKYSIAYKIEPYKGDFLAVYNKKANSDCQEAYANNCGRWSCICLRNGRLFPCACIPMAYQNQEKLGWSISEKELYASSSDIITNNGWDVLFKIYDAVELCRICAVNRRVIKWRNRDSMNMDDFFA